MFRRQVMHAGGVESENMGGKITHDLKSAVSNYSGKKKILMRVMQ